MAVMFCVVDWLTRLGVVESGSFRDFPKFLYSRAYFFVVAKIRRT